MYSQGPIPLTLETPQLSVSGTLLHSLSWVPVPVGGEMGFTGGRLGCTKGSEWVLTTPLHETLDQRPGRVKTVHTLECQVVGKLDSISSVVPSLLPPSCHHSSHSQEGFLRTSGVLREDKKTSRLSRGYSDDPPTPVGKDRRVETYLQGSKPLSTSRIGRDGLLSPRREE